MKSFLYLGDSIQAMADGRNMVMGLYTDRVLNLQVDPGTPLPTAEAPYAAATLSLLIAIFEVPPGTYVGKLTLLGPDGKPYPTDLPDPTIVVAPAGAANVILNFAPFIVLSFGTFTVRLELPGVGVAEDGFEVKRQTVPAKVPTKPGWTTAGAAKSGSASGALRTKPGRGRRASG